MLYEHCEECNRSLLRLLQAVVIELEYELEEMRDYQGGQA